MKKKKRRKNSSVLSEDRGERERERRMDKFKVIPQTGIDSLESSHFPSQMIDITHYLATCTIDIYIYISVSPQVRLDSFF
jgi:hypothetical protein